MTYRNYLPTVSLLAAILILAWVLYDVGQRFVPAWSSARNAAPVKVKAGAKTPSEDYRLNQIIAAHLFGVAPKQQPVVQQAPETRLRLTLLGVMASNRDDNARAVIASDAASDRSYSIGDRINGTDAKLYAIETDRVIIERGKRLEKLSLERPDLASAPSSPSRPPARARRAPQPRDTKKKSQRDRRKEAQRKAQQARRQQSQRPGSDGNRRPDMPRIPF
jgi:general secretion pathway protein C